MVDYARYYLLSSFSLMVYWFYVFFFAYFLKVNLFIAIKLLLLLNERKNYKKKKIEKVKSIMKVIVRI